MSAATITSIEQLPDEILALIVSRLVYPGICDTCGTHGTCGACGIYGNVLLVSWRFYHIMKDYLRKYYISRAPPAAYKDAIRSLKYYYEELTPEYLGRRGFTHNHPLWRKTWATRSGTCEGDYEYSQSITIYMNICTNGDIVHVSKASWVPMLLDWKVYCPGREDTCKCYEQPSCCNGTPPRRGRYQPELPEPM